MGNRLANGYILRGQHFKWWSCKYRLIILSEEQSALYTQMLISQASFAREATGASVWLYTTVTINSGSSVEKTKACVSGCFAPRGHPCNLSLANPRDSKAEKNYHNGKMNLGSQTIYWLHRSPPWGQRMGQARAPKGPCPLSLSAWNSGWSLPFPWSPYL